MAAPTQPVLGVDQCGEYRALRHSLHEFLLQFDRRGRNGYSVGASDDEPMLAIALNSTKLVTFCIQPGGFAGERFPQRVHKPVGTSTPSAGACIFGNRFWIGGLSWKALPELIVTE